MKRQLTRLVFDDASTESLESLRQKGVDVDLIEAALAGKIIQGSTRAPRVVSGAPPETPRFTLETDSAFRAPPSAFLDPDKALWQQLRALECPCGQHPKPRWIFFCPACSSALPGEIKDLLAEIEEYTGEDLFDNAVTDDIPRRYRLALSALRLQEPALRIHPKTEATA